MGVMYEYTGVVKKVGELLKFDNGFQKQELTLGLDIGQTENNPQYPTVMFFWFKKERTDKLKDVMPGSRVKVTFAIDCREWGDKQAHFTDLTGIKLDILAGGEPPAQKPVGTVDIHEDGAVADDMPF